MDHLDGLLCMISTVKQDATLPEETEDCKSHFIDCVNENTFESEVASIDTGSHTVEIVNLSLSVHCDRSSKQSACRSPMPADAVRVVNDECEQSFDEADDGTDVMGGYDDEPDVAEKRVLIDSVFFACDPASTGSVAVSDVITYLRDTLHVSTGVTVCIYNQRKTQYTLLINLNRYSL